MGARLTAWIVVAIVALTVIAGLIAGAQRQPGSRAGAAVSRAHDGGGSIWTTGGPQREERAPTPRAPAC
jgi:hypothetical protein